VPAVPVTISLLKVSSMVLKTDVGDATQTLVSDAGAPIQLNPLASYLEGTPMIGSTTMLPANSPISDPSLGETLKMWLAGSTLPAPCMFFTTAAGPPGMCLPKVTRDDPRVGVGADPPHPIELFARAPRAAKPPHRREA
jgi:hypothetical protein